MKCQWNWKTTTKKPISIFAPYNFLSFLDTRLHETRISETTSSEFFGNGVSVFSEILLIQKSSVHKRLVGTTNLG